MTRPALYLATPPSERPTLADLQRQADAVRAQIVANFLAHIVALQEEAAEIAAREAGHQPGVAESARRLLGPLHVEELNLRRLGA